ncbi:sugar phosphate nucleotidyltransferase [Candidatus Pelagibacter sp.]|nr:sugar phosphate nucleotidyltransferase [Candidatus Pelagibacter sp.]
MKKYEALILSGGKGTRVSKYTKKNPKCLIDINGKPFLYYQLEYLKKNNIKNVILSTGYKSNQIKDYIKNNINFINVKIVNDGKSLLGTGGAINKSIKLLKNFFYVIYGDSYLNFKLKNLSSSHKISIMAIYKNKNKYDVSNVELKKFNYIIYDKSTKKKYDYIDYGVSFLNKKIFKGIRKNIKFSLSALLENISKKKQLKGYIVKKRFYEIGSYSGIKQFKKYVKNEFYK